MTQQEYKQKRRECWEDLLQKHEISRVDGVTADAFVMAFDCAYALGKQEKDVEGVEMLMCEKSKVQEAYKTSKNIVNNELYGTCQYSIHTKIICVLKNLFGSKCLPDETNLSESLTCSEPKPSEPTNEGTRQEQCVPKNAESGTRSFNRIIKDSFRDERRLNIAAMITASIYSSDTISMQFNSIEAIVRKALDIADTLIAESEKKRNHGED